MDTVTDTSEAVHKAFMSYITCRLMRDNGSVNPKDAIALLADPVLTVNIAAKSMLMFLHYCSAITSHEPLEIWQDFLVMVEGYKIACKNGDIDG